MKKLELVYNEILRKKIKEKAKAMTQAELASSLGISLSTVNHALEPLRRMGAVNVKRRSLEVKDAKKILLYWAGIRNIEKDIIYSTRASGSVSEIEKRMPSDIIFAAYSAFKFMLRRIPADYSEVYVYASEKGYGDYASNERLPERNEHPKRTLNASAVNARGANEVDEIKKRFPPSKNQPNLFVMKKSIESMTLANIFVDLWNLREWYAKDFLKEAGDEIDRLLA